MTALCITASCHRTIPAAEAHRTACHHCEHQVRRWLAEIPRQLPLLQASLLPDRQGVPAGRATGRAHAPLPVRADVLALLGPGTVQAVRELSTDPDHPDQDDTVPIAVLLHAWCEPIAQARGDQLPPAAHAVAYLAAHLRYASTRTWWADMHRELGDLVAAVRRITHTEPRRRQMRAPCPGCHAFALAFEDWAEWIECEACGRLLSQTEYDSHAAAVMPPLARIALAMVTGHQLAADTETAAGHPAPCGPPGTDHRGQQVEITAYRDLAAGDRCWTCTTCGTCYSTRA